MTREDAKGYLAHLKRWQFVPDNLADEALDMAIKALEQDIVPFDFELYEAGLMDMPKEMIEVLDKIRAEITAISTHEQIDEHTALIRTGDQVKQMALNIIDKYNAESEDQNGR